MGEGKNRTAQKVKQLLGAVFALAVEDYDFKNPMTKIKLPHYEVKKGSPLSKAEEKQLIEFCKNNPHLYGIHSLLVLLYTGMRLGELASMKIESENNYTFITCETEKTRKGYATIRRRIPISPMFRKVWDKIDFEKAKAASSKTLSDTIKRVFRIDTFTNFAIPLSAVAKSADATWNLSCSGTDTNLTKMCVPQRLTEDTPNIQMKSISEILKK